MKKITSRVDGIKKFNCSLIRHLEIFVAKITVERKEIIRTNFEQVENVAKLYNQMDKMKIELSTFQ